MSGYDDEFDDNIDENIGDNFDDGNIDEFEDEMQGADYGGYDDDDYQNPDYEYEEE